MKKNSIFLTLVILISSTIFSQIPQLQWANSIGQPTGNDLGYKLIPDNSGNLYFVGRFSGTVDFDPGPAVSNLTAGGANDIVIGKYNSAGGLLWVKQLGGNRAGQLNAETISPQDAKLDNAGNLYITGFYVGSVDIDPSTATYLLNPNPIGPAGEMIFLASYSGTGDFRWGFGYGWQDQLGGYNNEGDAIEIDNAGDILITGMYHHTCDFDPSPATYNLTANGTYMDVFIAKYSSSGNFIWAKSIGGNGINDTSTDLLVDAGNNIYITGYIDVAADFDPSPGVAMVSSNGGGGDIYLAKYNSAGDYQWAFSAGSSVNYDIGSALLQDNAGNIVLAGMFQGTVDFDPSGTTHNVSSTGMGNSDAFISKYSASGNFLWAKKLEGLGNDGIKSGNIKTDVYERIYVYGYFSGTLDFDPSGNTAIISAGAASQGCFIAQYDTDGNYLNSSAIFGANMDSYILSHGFATDNNLNLYCTGGYWDVADFDMTSSVYNLTAGGTSQDIYLAKYQLGTAGLSGKSWIDGNLNGILDIGESGLSGVKLEMIYDKNNNGVIEPGEGKITTTSAVDGSYSFERMPQGEYIIHSATPVGQMATTPTSGDGDLADGQIVANRNFGFSSITLAVTCRSFSFRLLDKSIELHWLTESEQNSKGFNLQRSADGVNFQNIGWINSQGNSTSTQNYIYTDNNVTAEGKYFYRLQEEDVSGNQKYVCNVLVVKIPALNNQFSIYPNPTNDFVNISGIKAGNFVIVTDAAGRKRKEIKMVNITGTAQINIADLNPGLYIISVAEKHNIIYSSKLIKN